MRACLALEHTPQACRIPKVVFIQKPGQINFAQAKDFRPISLTSFFLKTMERMVDRYIRDTVLKNTPLHDGQQAYRAGHSVKSALHMVVSRIEVQIEIGEYSLGTFLDIDGAFSATKYQEIYGEAESHVVPSMSLPSCLGGYILTC